MLRATLITALLIGLASGACARVNPSASRAPRPGAEPLEGFGAKTSGGAGGRVITISEASEEAVRQAFRDAASAGHAVIRFAVESPIAVSRPLPPLRAPRITVEGGGVTLDGTALRQGSALFEIRTHDVIVRDLRIRNGDDNLRVQGDDAWNVVITHVSSTGANDDGISIGYGAHDVTVQYAFLAGNTRSLFCKYGDTTNISLHHSWIQKGWTRSPLFSGPVRADMRNVIVEDWGEWGARFEDGASGNVVSSLFLLSPHATRIGGKPHAALRFARAGPVYTEGNVFRGEARGAQVGTARTRIAAPAVRTLGISEMERMVRERAGCLPRDEIDRTYIGLRDGWTVTSQTALRPNAKERNAHE